MELRQITEKTFYIENPTRVGVVRLEGNKVCLIDSGNDRDSGRRIKKLLDNNGMELEYIVNTHSHADHVGGNAYLQKNTGCRIYAPGIECAITRYPILEPSLCFGAYPPKEMQHKGWMAQGSDAELLTGENVPGGMELIPLHGHYFEMTGLRTQDGVVFLGDSLSSPEILEKYKICYLYDVGESLASLERMKGMDARLFVPSHVEPTENIAPLAQLNIDWIMKVAEKVLELCWDGKGFEQVLQALFRDYGMKLELGQYYLIGSTLHAYLSWLKAQGRLEVYFEDCQLIWKTI